MGSRLFRQKNERV